MTVKELIEELSKLPEDLEIKRRNGSLVLELQLPHKDNEPTATEEEEPVEE